MISVFIHSIGTLRSSRMQSSKHVDEHRRANLSIIIYAQFLSSHSVHGGVYVLRLSNVLM